MKFDTIRYPLVIIKTKDFEFEQIDVEKSQKKIIQKHYCFQMIHFIQSAMCLITPSQIIALFRFLLALLEQEGSNSSKDGQNEVGRRSQKELNLRQSFYFEQLMTLYSQIE